jgi:hypothetical protein
MKLPLIPLATAIAAIFAGSARADQTAIAFDVTKLWGLDGGTGVFGWQFTTHSDIQVSALGIYDSFSSSYVGDGLLESHPIAIWDVSNQSSPLVSGIIPDNDNAPLVNGFRYVSTPLVTLAAGHNYVIGALYPHTWDQTTGAPNNQGFVLTVDPAISFGGYAWINSTGLSFPGNYQAGLQFAFGPNFTFTTIPEPSTSALGTLAVVALLGSAKILRLRRE